MKKREFANFAAKIQISALINDRKSNNDPHSTADVAANRICL